MNHLVSHQTLLEKITNAIDEEQHFLALRNFILAYYGADDDYVFESKEVEMVFAVIASYLEFEEAFGDPQRGLRLRRLKKALEEVFTPESAICALEHDRISALLEKLELGIIPEFTFERQVRKLSPINVNWKRVLRLYKSHPEFRHLP